MTKAVILTWLTLAALIEGFFLGGLGGGDLTPHLVLVAVLLAAARADPKAAVVYGVWGGFWLDVIGLTYFGIRSLMLGAWGLLIWRLHRIGIDLQRRTTIAIIASLGSLFFSLSFWLAALLDTGRYLEFGQFLSQWVVTAMLSGSLAWLLSFRSAAGQRKQMRIK